MPLRKHRDVSGDSFLSDLMAQLFSDRVRLDAARCCSYNGFFGLVLLGGAFVFVLSGRPNPLGTAGLGFVITSALVLLAALVIPTLRPRLVPALLAAQGLVVMALTLWFSIACAAWAIGPVAPRSFRYLPGLIATGATYGATLWADFGRPYARPRRWRLAGFVAGIVLEVMVAALIVTAMLRTG